MTPLRVLMTADAVGGVWQYAIDVATGLSGKGAHIVLAVTGPAPRRPLRKSALAIPNLRLLHKDFALEWMLNGSADATRSGQWLRGIADWFEPDVVHVNGYAHACLPWPCPVVVVAHSCVRTWWRAVHRCDPPPEWNAYIDTVAEALTTADIVVGPTSSFLDAMANAYGPLPRRRTIWNGRHLPIADAGTRNRALAAGRFWDKAKNLTALAAAASALPSPVYVAGDTGDIEGNHHHGGNGLRFLGRLGDREMQRQYAKASVFASPARYEPFGLAVLEAAQYGCALVLGDIPTQRELWSGAARFVDPDNPAQLAKELRRLLRMPDLAATLGQKARQHARRYDADRMLQNYLDTYGTLLGRTVHGAAPHAPQAAGHTR